MTVIAFPAGRRAKPRTRPRRRSPLDETCGFCLAVANHTCRTRSGRPCPPHVRRYGAVRP